MAIREITFSMDEVRLRLKDYLVSENLTNRGFEQRCGLYNGFVKDMDSKISFESLSKIGASCPNLDLGWLFSGVGRMNTTTGDGKSEHYLPLIPIEVFAGPGEPAYEDERIEDYYTVSDFKESDFLIRVKGDSMVPKYNGGDIVACKKVDKSNLYFLQWGRVYVIYTMSQGAMIKRIQPSKKDGWITCVSENIKYAPFDVPMDDIVSIALVNGSISLE